MGHCSGKSVVVRQVQRSPGNGCFLCQSHLPHSQSVSISVNVHGLHWNLSLSLEEINPKLVVKTSKSGTQARGGSKSVAVRQAQRSPKNGCLLCRSHRPPGQSLSLSLTEWTLPWSNKFGYLLFPWGERTPFGPGILSELDDTLTHFGIVFVLQSCPFIIKLDCIEWLSKVVLKYIIRLNCHRWLSKLIPSQ